MNNKLDAFAGRIFDYCVKKIGLARTRSLVFGVAVAYVLGVIKLIWWLWIAHGPVVAIVSIVLGLALHLATSLRQQPRREINDMDGGYSQRHPDSALLSAERLLYFFLPKEVRENLLGDLQEEYPEMRRKLGSRSAKWWLYKQVMTSLWPMLQTAGRDLAKWGLIGWFEEFIRRIAH